MENKADAFVRLEILKIENRVFWGQILGASIGYLLITLWLNSIRAEASLWLVWVLIIAQFALYFSIFISSYRRSMVLGLNKNLALALFFAVAILGRFDDWEVAIIPMLVAVMLFLSARNQRVSGRYEAMIQGCSQTCNDAPLPKSPIESD
jgi:hypothetical protein